jgi:hypothetical protein
LILQGYFVVKESTGISVLFFSLFRRMGKEGASAKNRSLAAHALMLFVAVTFPYRYKMLHSWPDKHRAVAGHTGCQAGCVMQFCIFCGVLSL